MIRVKNLNDLNTNAQRYNCHIWMEDIILADNFSDSRQTINFSCICEILFPSRIKNIFAGNYAVVGFTRSSFDCLLGLFAAKGVRWPFMSYRSTREDNPPGWIPLLLFFWHAQSPSHFHSGSCLVLHISNQFGRCAMLLDLWHIPLPSWGGGFVVTTVVSR